MLPKPYGNFPRVAFTDPRALSKVIPSPGCYRLICVTAGKSYVGATSNMCRRFLQHRQDLEQGRHPNSKLQWAYNKCGPGAFVFQTLEVYHGKWSKDCLTPKEQRWIDAHTRRYNIRPAGSDEWLAGQEATLPALKSRLLSSRLRPITKGNSHTRGPANLRAGKTQVGGTSTSKSGPSRTSGGDTRRPRRQLGRRK